MMFKYLTCLVLFITWYQYADCHPAKSDIRSIDTMVDKESDTFLSVEAEQSNQKAGRNKRTIGFLRQLFPNFSQIVDRKIQQITRFLFRVIGRLVLRGGGGGAGGGGGGGGATTGNTGGGDSGRRISITLPTYPPSEDDDDEDEDAQTDVPAAAAIPSTDSIGITASPVSAVASVAATESTAAPAETVADPTAPAETVADPTAPVEAASDVVVVTTGITDTSTTTAAAATTTTTTSSSSSSSSSSQATITTAGVTVTTIGPTTLRPSDTDNTVATTILKRTVRQVSTTEEKQSPLTDTENDVATDSDTSNANDDAQVETAEDDPRNKRFLFNLRGSGGGGSGNVLFDIIRRGADRAARAAGGFYRVVAGTDPNTLTLTQPLQYPSLVAGSGANQDRDESSHEPSVRDVHDVQAADLNAKEDGYNAGVPGPLTRIFIIGNRGIANLIQDLILRLAQTTERLVNFKARLITSLI